MKTDACLVIAMYHFWRVGHTDGPLSFLTFRSLLEVLDRLMREEWRVEYVSTRIDFFSIIPHETLSHGVVPHVQDILEVAADGLYTTTPAISMLPEEEFRNAKFIRVRMRPKERIAPEMVMVLDFWVEKPANALVRFPFRNFHNILFRKDFHYLHAFKWTSSYVPPPEISL